MDHRVKVLRFVEPDYYYTFKLTNSNTRSKVNKLMAHSVGIMVAELFADVSTIEFDDMFPNSKYHEISGMTEFPHKRYIVAFYDEPSFLQAKLMYA